MKGGLWADWLGFYTNILNQILYIVYFVFDQSWIFVFRKSPMLGFSFSRGGKERKGKDGRKWQKKRRTEWNGRRKGLEGEGSGRKWGSG